MNIYMEHNFLYSMKFLSGIQCNIMSCFKKCKPFMLYIYVHVRMLMFTTACMYKLLQYIFISISNQKVRKYKLIYHVEYDSKCIYIVR